MASVIDNNPQNQRAFPRIAVTCPVLYRLASSKAWKVGRLVDFSATGICMVCDGRIPEGVHISVQIKPGSQKTVPELAASGLVLRVVLNEEQKYVVSCKLTKVHR
ncbi:MAG TPA: PilZ domain-containing protein [Gammaproteobacteria bacterium]|nr:PilZ domain-containing protein [Gammaproteobacteria bacterium]